MIRGGCPPAIRIATSDPSALFSYCRPPGLRPARSAIKERRSSGRPKIAHTASGLGSSLNAQPSTLIRSRHSSLVTCHFSLRPALPLIGSVRHRGRPRGSKGDRAEAHGSNSPRSPQLHALRRLNPPQSCHQIWDTSIPPARKSSSPRRLSEIPLLPPGNSLVRGFRLLHSGSVARHSSPTWFC